jgi:type IV secretory pathway VirB10-like protein
MARKLTNRDVANLLYVAAVLNHSTNQPMQPTLHAALSHCLGLIGEVTATDPEAQPAEPQGQDAPAETKPEPPAAPNPAPTAAERSAAATKAAATRKANKRKPAATAKPSGAAGNATRNANSEANGT